MSRDIVPRPGDRTWRVTAAGELVVVTARRGLRIVVAGVAGDPSEGIGDPSNPDAAHPS